MTQLPAAAPLPQTTGLVPRYLRERAAARVVLPAPLLARGQTVHASDLLCDQRPVDAATADLRHRIAAAGGRPRRSRLAAVGASLALAALFSD